MVERPVADGRARAAYSQGFDGLKHVEGANNVDLSAQHRVDAACRDLQACKVNHCFGLDSQHQLLESLGVGDIACETGDAFVRGQHKTC